MNILTQSQLFAAAGMLLVSSFVLGCYVGLFLGRSQVISAVNRIMQSQKHWSALKEMTVGIVSSGEVAFWHTKPADAESMLQPFIQTYGKARLGSGRGPSIMLLAAALTVATLWLGGYI